MNTGSDRTCGVYFLFSAEHELVYIGKSENCETRIKEHKANGRAFSFFYIMPAPRNAIHQLEKSLIRSFVPPQNGLGLPEHLKWSAKQFREARKEATSRLNLSVAPSVYAAVYSVPDMEIERTRLGETMTLTEAYRVLGHLRGSFRADVHAGRVRSVITGKKRLVLSKDVLGWRDKRFAELGLRAHA